MRESTIQSRMLQWLNQQPTIWAYKAQASAYTGRGVPDIIACVGGVFMAFEVKTATGKTTALQDNALRAINAAGGTAHVVRSLDEVKTLVQHAMKKDPAR